jgi:hypothetical protein
MTPSVTKAATLLFAAGTLLVVAPTRAAAGYTTQSAAIVDYQYLAPGHFEGGEAADYWNIGAAGSSADASGGGFNADIGSSASGSASASVNLFPIAGRDAGIHLSVSAKTGGGSGMGGLTHSYAMGEWVDVIRTGGGPLAGGLRIHVEVEGYVSLTLTPGRDARIGISVGSSTTPDLPSGKPISVSGDSGVGFILTPPPFKDFPYTLDVNAGGVQDLVAPAEGPAANHVEGTVSWATDLALAYRPALGGYNLNLFAFMSAEGWEGGNVTGDFGNTIRITGVTLADGTDVSNLVTFESGFTLNSDAVAAPAPAGLLLGLTGAGCLAPLGWVRRRKPAATA